MPTSPSEPARSRRVSSAPKGLLNGPASLTALFLLFVLGTSLLALHIDNGSVFPLLVVPIALIGAVRGVRTGLIASVGASLITGWFIMGVMGRVHAWPYVAVAVVVYLVIGGAVGAVSDLYRRVRTQEEEIKESLREKELLLREVHHRVKNDLHLVGSLLTIQAAYSENREVRRALTDASGRITVVARAYDKLRATEDKRLVELSELLESLADGWNEAAGETEHSVGVESEEIALPSRLGISIGIIANELVTNSKKHAKPDGGPVAVSVHLREIDGSGVELQVRDDGNGLPEEIVAGHGYGITFVDELVEQYDGSIEAWNDGGAVTTVRIPTRDGESNRPAGKINLKVAVFTGKSAVPLPILPYVAPAPDEAL